MYDPGFMEQAAADRRCRLLVEAELERRARARTPRGRGGGLRLKVGLTLVSAWNRMLGGTAEAR